MEWLPDNYNPPLNYKPSKEMTEDYKAEKNIFNEDAALKELRKYIDTTYEKHYASGNIQSTEFIFDAGHGESFCLGNIIKYAQRYGKKDGENVSDVLKLCHYAIMLLGNHINYNLDPFVDEKEWQ
jgi:hypothetical protein